jgi:bifunctional DNA-binding transcriptional regulator/antitoxin component of YhaV-PrlF toxin-antitoxin module
MRPLTVTAKGQVTLKREVLEHLGVHPGDRISVLKLPDGRIKVKAAQPAARIADAFDLLKREGGASLSVDEIGAIAAEGWAGRR